MAKRILFQGDSITDCGRPREVFGGLGTGYPNLVAAALGTDFAGDYEFLNRGIGGNRIVDLFARIKADFINLNPDYASILIGVNDAWHEINWQNGVDTQKFETVYGMIVDELKAACPQMKLFLMAPYVLEGTATCATEEAPDKWERFRSDVDEKIEAVKRVAQKKNLPLVELQPIFDEACKKAPAAYWLRDGVHPTPQGHELIKRAWLEMFQKIK